MRGIKVSESTAGTILAQAKERIEAQRETERRRLASFEAKRYAKAAKDRAEAAKRREYVRGWLRENLGKVSGSGMIKALATDGFKFKRKDLTPELEALADEFLSRFEANYSGEVSSKINPAAHPDAGCQIKSWLLHLI